MSEELCGAWLPTRVKNTGICYSHLPAQSGLVLWSQPPTFNVYYTQIIEKSSAELLISDWHVEAEVIKVVMEQCSGWWKCSPGMGLD